MGHDHSHHRPQKNEDPNATMSNLSVISRSHHSHSDHIDKAMRFSSVPAANTTMSLILPPIPDTSPSPIATTPALFSKSYSVMSVPKSARSATCTASPSSFTYASSASTLSTVSSLPRSMSSGHGGTNHRRRKSSLLIVNNGVTGKYISSRICKIAAKFWHKNIESLTVPEQLEIGCSIFFGMLSSTNEMKQLMRTNFNDSLKIEATSLKYLDMMGWLIRYLITDNIDLYALLTKLGVMHRAMGIQIHHFTPMLSSTHETLAYYFENNYSIEVKYAMDEIFSLAAQLMTGQALNRSAYLMEMTEQFSAENIPFLKNLDVCLKSSIGKEYLYRYLAQTWCDEIAIFLQSLYRFKHGMSDKERFMIAREIIKASIEPAATFALNLSYDLRTGTLMEMSKLEVLFMAKEQFKLSTEFFMMVEKEINKLIMDNHWTKFVDGIETLHSKSFTVE